MSYDNDFEEPLKAVAEIGVQVVVYEFEEKALSARLRATADRVIRLDRTDAADLFTVPRYFVEKENHLHVPETESWVAEVAAKVGWEPTTDRLRARVDAIITDTADAPRPRSRPFVVAVTSDGVPRVACQENANGSSFTWHSGTGAEDALRSFFQEVD